MIIRGNKAWEEIKKAISKKTSDKKLSLTVSEIIESVRKDGDAALIKLARRFEEPTPEKIILTDEDVRKAVNRVSSESRQVIERAAENIRAFAGAVVKSIQPVRLERDCYIVGMDYRPVASVGCYVPSGRYPLPSSALMTAITAKAAGVKNIAIASPKMPDEVIYAGIIAGATRFYKIGGAQAIAALAFGTKSISPVDLIVGPGNAYVTEAKRQLAGIVGIDMLAGPSEVVIIADEGANPEWLATEMRAQAEHDPLTGAWLLTDSNELAKKMGDKTLRILVLKDFDECALASDMLAPEHLVLAVKDPGSLKAKLKNYGALFMGNEATVVFGDYMSGPNHTLPTGTTARFSEGLNPRTFLRAQSWFAPKGDVSSLAKDTFKFAQIEGLYYHAEAARLRIKSL